MTTQIETMLNFPLSQDNPSGEFILAVSPGIQQIEFKLNLAGKQWCQLTIHDINGCRGQLLLTHLHETVTGMIGLELITTSATMLVGEIPSGNWRVTYEISGSEKNSPAGELTIKQRQQGILTPENAEIDIMKDPPEKNEQGWLKGDFHTHTFFSDGKMSPSDNLSSGIQQELDFFIATDHQVVTHHWPKSQVAVYAGVELTTDFGHGNFLGVQQLLVEDYQAGQLTQPTKVLELIKKNQGNGLFSINHPFLTPWEWQLGELPLAYISAMEICNDPTFADNALATEKALTLWSLLWQDGWKITGVGGSDSHLLPTEKYPDSHLPSLIGDPATYVFVNHLTKMNLLQSVRAGHTIISRVGKLDFTLADGASVLPGQELTAYQGSLTVSTQQKEVSCFQWILDGELVKEETGKSSHFDFNLSPASYHWLRIDLRDLAGNFLATLTPIYWGEKSPTLKTWKEALNGCKF